MPKPASRPSVIAVCALPDIQASVDWLPVTRRRQLFSQVVILPIWFSSVTAMS